MRSIVQGTIEVSGRLSSLWMMARAAAREIYWSHRERKLRTTWVDTQMAAYLSQQRKRTAAELTSDAEAQCVCADKLGFDIYSRAMTALALLADHTFSVNRAGAESKVHEASFQEALDGLQASLYNFLRYPVSYLGVAAKKHVGQGD